MTSRKRNLSIIGLVLVLLAASAALIVTKPTVLGLDLRGGVELVYEARPTPQVPEVTQQSVDDAIETIRKRTDALGVSEPEIQRAGANQISIGLPNVSNADRAIDQVGTTAQLQMYDWEPNVFTEGEDGKLVPFQQVKQQDPTASAAPFGGSKGLFRAVEGASALKPRAEATDLPPGGASEEIKRRFDNDTKRIQRYYDQRNDTRNGPAYYLFGPDDRLITGPDTDCKELLADFEGVDGPQRKDSQIPKGGACREELAKIPVGNARGQRPGQTEQRVQLQLGPAAGQPDPRGAEGHRGRRGRQAEREPARLDQAVPRARGRHGAVGLEHPQPRGQRRPEPWPRGEHAVRRPRASARSRPPPSGSPSAGAR